MKKTTLLMVGAAAAAFAAPAHADGPYFGIEGGVSFRDRVIVDIETPTVEGTFRSRRIRSARHRVHAAQTPHADAATGRPQ